MQREAHEAYKQPHLQPCKKGQDFPVWFNREIFANDFIAAWEKYCEDLSNNDDLFKKALKRIELRGYLYVGNVSEFCD